MTSSHASDTSRPVRIEVTVDNRAALDSIALVRRDQTVGLPRRVLKHAADVSLRVGGGYGHDLVIRSGVTREDRSTGGGEVEDREVLVGLTVYGVEHAADI